MGAIGSERRRCEQASFHRSRCWRSPAVTACLGSWPALIILIGVMLITWSTEGDPPTTAERPRLHTGRCGEAKLEPCGSCYSGLSQNLRPLQRRRASCY